MSATLEYKGSTKFIISNNNVILEKSNTWYRYPFYMEKTINDNADYDVIIETKDNIDYYVKLYVITDNNTDYSNYFQIPVETIKSVDLTNSDLIDDKKLSISALSITKFMQSKL